MAVTSIRAELAAFINHQRLVFHALVDDLLREPPRTLLDIFSGMSLCPLALVKAGLISKAHMIDGKELYSNEISNTISALGLEDRASISQVKLDLDTGPSMLPDVGHITVIETGLSLPRSVRDNAFHSDRSLRTTDFRVSPLDNTGAIDTVLKLVENNSARTMRIIDTPKAGTASKDVTSLTVAYIQKSIEDIGSTWEIDKALVAPETGTQFIKLRR